MKLPERIQRKRTKGWKQPANTRYCGRGSKWGNPFVVGRPYIEIHNSYFFDGIVTLEKSLEYYELTCMNYRIYTLH